MVSHFIRYVSIRINPLHAFGDFGIFTLYRPKHAFHRNVSVKVKLLNRVSDRNEFAEQKHVFRHAKRLHSRKKRHTAIKRLAQQQLLELRTGSLPLQKLPFNRLLPSAQDGRVAFSLLSEALDY